MENFVSKVKWYLSNIPVGSFLLFFTASFLFYYTKSREIPDTVVCLQPQRVISGEGALRILKHVFFHKNFETLSMTLVLLGLFGTIAERQIGTLRFLYTFLILTVSYSVLTVLVAIGLAFTTQFAAVMYSCPGLGMTAPMLGMVVITFKNMPMKRTVIFFFTIRTFLIPWCLLVIVQVVVPDLNLVSSICGCLAGTIYAYGLSSCIGLPISCLSSSDNFCLSVFQWIPLIKYIRGISVKLPVHRQDIAMQKQSTDSDSYPQQVQMGNSVGAHQVPTTPQTGEQTYQYPHTVTTSASSSHR
uniref:Uncharacterized protein LOC100185242 n=1 Tax=Phallusia mammillata TaxID=59560 RepID=A0A6F9DJ38_9ASCI|nr:uncharacterized protein LOC100185242 [Phallusia mammillata]